MNIDPQLTPSEHCYAVLQDHGLEDGGWGIAAATLQGNQIATPLVYSGSNEDTIAMLRAMTQASAAGTGKPTRLVRFTNRVDVACFDREGEYVGGENGNPDTDDRT